MFYGVLNKSYYDYESSLYKYTVLRKSREALRFTCNSDKVYYVQDKFRFVLYASATFLDLFMHYTLMSYKLLRYLLMYM